MPVTVIKSRPHLMIPQEVEVQKRVAAYCRVSTDSDEQETSYDAQVNHYATYIEAHPGWTLAGIYADQGISGTQASKRPEFTQLIEDCEAGAVDLVITKSISRFARNTLDCLNYIRKLKALSIPILFEKENINTMEGTGEVLVTILASLAQQESASISANIRMGIEYGFQEGKCRFNYSDFLGLTKNPQTGKIEIVPGEADTIRRIFRDYLDGFSTSNIASRLTEEGVSPPAGGTKWYATTVDYILRNEKYCGDLLMQKYFTKDFLTHKVVKNEGQRPQYFIENNHDPVVPKEIFYQVQGEMQRRIVSPKAAGKYALSGKVVDGITKVPYHRFSSKSDRGVVYWRPETSAGKRRKAGGREEEELKAAVLWAFTQLPKHRDEIEKELKEVAVDEISRIDAEIAQSFSDGEAERDKLYLSRAELANRGVGLRILLELMKPRLYRGWEPACREADEFFERTRGDLKFQGEWDEALVNRYVERVEVFEERVDVVFKGEVRVTVTPSLLTGGKK